MEKTRPREQAVLISLNSATLEAVYARGVDVEASFTKGLPNFSIVGLPSDSIKESKERVKSALLNNGFTFPPLRITINLAPSDIRKEGSHFDLPIALLIAGNKKPLVRIFDSPFYVFGELGLDGSVKETASIYPIVLSLAKVHKEISVLTSTDAAEKIAAIPNVRAYGITDLKEGLAFLYGEEECASPLPTRDIEAKTIELDQPYYFREEYSEDFFDVIGQEAAKRAALIAAAGMHNILFSGSPGSGKSMIVKRMRGIMPPLSLEEVLDGAMRMADEGKAPQFVPKRPYRQPHHTATRASIFGGGSRQSQMGEVALAHGGILFFDELPHFQKSILEALREPLEDHRLLISRVNTKVEYEAAFLFAGAMNPCPCGNLLSQTKSCRCTEQEVVRYKNRLSEPFIDRIDLYVEMDEKEEKATARIDSKTLHKKVIEAFAMQKKRGQKKANGKMEDTAIEEICKMTQEAAAMLEKAVGQYGLSMRGRNKVLKVSRTIADLESSEKIEKVHLLEALRYRYRN